MSIKIKTDKMKGKNYDYKEAYNKNLTAKARLHYLENARNDQDNSPAKQVGVVDPLTGQPVQQMTNVPPQQANTLGTAQPVFKPQAQQAAQGIYGGVDQRQNSVGATPLFQKEFQREPHGLTKELKPKFEQPVKFEPSQPSLIKQPQKQSHFKKFEEYLPIRDQKMHIDTKIEKVKPQRL